MRALGVALACPAEANEVFVELDPDVHRALGRTHVVHQPDPALPVVRLVCSWATTPADVNDVLAAVRALL